MPPKPNFLGVHLGMIGAVVGGIRVRSPFPQPSIFRTLAST